MFPKICTIGPVTIYSYGLMLAVSVLLCSFLLKKEASRKGINSELMFDLVFWVVLIGIVGARLFYVFLNFKYFMQHPIEIVMISNGGLAFQGGLIAGALSAVIFIKKKKLPFLKTADLIAPYLALGQAIGRIGCFLNGCCHGVRVDWGVFFPVHQARLHPTQLYEAVGLLAIFFLLRQFQNKTKIEGHVFVLYLILAPLLRMFVQFYREDYHPLFLGLSIFQLICCGLLMVAFFLLFSLRKKD